MPYSNLLLLIGLTVFGISFLFAFFINIFLLRYSGKRLSKEAPVGQMRWETKNKPVIGGLSFMLTFVFAVILYLLFFQVKDVNFSILQTGMLLSSVSLGFLLGFFDDLRNAPVWSKFTIQFIVAFLVVFSKNHIHLTHITWLDYTITIIWVVGIMNSLNMLDNMDGITGVVSLIILASVLILGIRLSTLTLFHFFIIISAIAALIAFLIFNYNPSKLYMGDCGSQFLGALIAILSIRYIWNAPDITGIELQTKQISIVALLFIVPLSDTITVFYKRIRRGKSPFFGGRDHTTHHLVYAGFSVKQVFWTFTGIELISLLLSYFIIFKITVWSLGHFAAVLLYCIVIFGILFYVANLNKNNN